MCRYGRSHLVAGTRGPVTADPDSPERRTYTRKDRPHLATYAIEALGLLGDRGVKLHTAEVALLAIMCDKVSASHGQWYGSMEKLAENVGQWERHWYAKWLRRLAERGLVENLGKLPGRKLDTWQILPELYPLVVTPTTTSKEGDGQDGRGNERYHALVVTPDDPLVVTPDDLLVVTSATTNTVTPRTPKRTPPYGAAEAASTRIRTASMNHQKQRNGEAQ
jgi:hypothetical protein